MREPAGMALPSQLEGPIRWVRIMLISVLACGALAACGDGSTSDTSRTSTPAPSATTSSLASQTSSSLAATSGAPVSSTVTVPSTSAAPPSSTTLAAPPTSATTTPVTNGSCPATQWSLRQRLGQLVMVGVDPTGPADARQAVGTEGAGGIFIGGVDTGLLKSGALPDLVAPTGVRPFVAIDEEGGRVQRIDALVGDLPSARKLAATASVADITRLAQARARAMRSLGVTVDFAPVIDVSDQPTNEVIGDRSFSNDAATVTRDAEAFAEGLRQGGVLPVFKHFPGHGHATGDSHKGTSTDPPLDRLGPDLQPYRDLLPRWPGAAVMVGHLVVPNLTDGLPASLSPAAITDLLRGQFGFKGLVFTDDLTGMKAVTERYGHAEAVRRSLAAGADVALLGESSDLPAVLDSLEQAVGVGTLPESRVDSAVAHVMVAKGYACD